MNIRHVAEIDKRSFVAYYNKHGILPVSQDIADKNFYFRRESLYKLLGLPPQCLRNRSILEFGPGGGYNATAITIHQPSTYVFVDASVSSLLELNRKKAEGLYGNVHVEINQSNIFDYTDSRKFDLVVIEGVIPGQTKPTEMLQHASTFVSQCGFLITTTTTATSLLSEVCRRLFQPFIVRNRLTFEDQANYGCQIFESHLRSLGTKTRPTSDWVLDWILHTWEKDSRFIFSMTDCLSALGSSFDFLGSSPSFLVDDRFYKSINRNTQTSNDLLKLQFPKISLALIDSRVRILDAMKLVDIPDVESKCLDLF
jgi:2-polyprenyl-3-methyl-5-hydroxy-6-metoxy-1,4-benzoquinol methylase